MDNLDSPAPAQPDMQDLQAQCDSLRQLIISVLILLIVVSGTFTIFLLRQYRLTNGDLAQLESQFRAEQPQYNRAKLVMDDFVRQIREYSYTHPDFTPILSKYNIPVAQSPAAPKK
jgi:hypothetical protein